MKTTKTKSADVFDDSRSTDGTNIRVKRPSEQYSEKRFAARHVKTGQPVVDGYGRDVMTQSEAAKARAGVVFKLAARRSGLDVHISEHERGLIDEMATDHDWCGKFAGEDGYEVQGGPQIKALLDESGGSQGLELVPIEFDSDIVSFPLLHGELFPQVDVKNVSRGRRMEGGSLATPTMSWGGGDDSSITLFNTAAMANAIDTTTHTVDGAVEVGRDFLSDAGFDVGAMLTTLVGERLMAELDNVIATGDGSTQPTGIDVAGQITSTVSSDNGGGGPATFGDYVSLLFGVGKQYRRNPANRMAFVSNDTTYQRSREIQIDTASPSVDQRPVFTNVTVDGSGGQIQNYQTLGLPHLVQNDLSNQFVACVALAKYRMYRRIGLDIRFEMGGTTLARRNMALLIYRARFGGQMVDASAGAKITDLQS